MNRSILYGLLGFIVLLAGILTVALIIARDETEMLDRIRSFIETGQADRARSELADLERRGFSTPEGLIEAARLLSTIDVAQSNRLLGELLERDDVNDAAFRRAAELAIEIGNLPLGRNFLEESMRLNPGSADAFRIGGILNFEGGHFREASLFFDSAFGRMQPSRRDQIAHGRALILSGDTDRLLRGKQILWDLAEGDDTFSADALIALGAFPNIPLLPDEREEIVQRLQDHPLREARLSESPPMMRQIIAAFEPSHPEFALETGRVLMRTTDLTTRDRISFAFLALRRNAPEDAERALSAITGMDRELAEVRGLAAFTRMLSHETGQGVREMETLAAEAPGNPAVMMILEGMLFENRPPLSISETEALANLLLAHPLVTVQSALRSYELLLEIRPLRRQDILEKAWARYAETNAVALALWLRQQNDIPRLLRLTESEAAKTDARLLSLRFDALLSQGNIEKLAEEFNRYEERLDEGNRLLLRADLAIRRNAENAWKTWDEALQRSINMGRSAGIRRLALIALQNGDQARAHRAYRRLFIDGTPMAREELEMLMSLSLEHGTFDNAVEVAERAADRFPDDAGAQNNAAYLNFLRGTRLDHYLSIMEEVVRNNPGVRNYRMTLALGRLRAGRAQEALRLAEETQLDMTPEGAQGQAIYAAVLAANDRRAMAASFARNIDRSRLLREEWNLIAEIVN